MKMAYLALILRKKQRLVMRTLILISTTFILTINLLSVNSNYVQQIHQESRVLRVLSESKSNELSDGKTSFTATLDYGYSPNKRKIQAETYQDVAFVVPSIAEEIEGPGEMGKPVILTNLTQEQQELERKGMDTYGYNQYVSDVISVHRSLPDYRDEQCHDIEYPTNELPQTSVIICFHNEAWSVLLRTVHSVLERSPDHLIREIILVDDFSNLPHLKENLDVYLSKFSKVKIIRTNKREGLIRARLIGTSIAKGPILTFLDSHCECTDGWLEPLLHRIHRNRTTVVSPVINTIDLKTFEYSNHGIIRHIGGFDWELVFKWRLIPPRIGDARTQTWAPVETATMAGGLFSIDKKFFEHLGTYDEGFDTWGAENLELSFKTWMCGGKLEIIPCSHVGHVYRESFPYSFLNGKDDADKNSIRLAEVWMDEYAQYFYETLGSRKIDYGDVRSRIELRKRLKCHSFKWYLDNVYPELYVPNNAIARGQIWSKFMMDRGIMCMTGSTKDSESRKEASVELCHGMGQNQFWVLTAEGEIRRDETCLDFDGYDLSLYNCHGGKRNQFWMYDTRTNKIRHVNTGLCLEIMRKRQALTMGNCTIHDKRQKWMFQAQQKLLV